MNFLKKKLKPLTAGFNQQASQSGQNQQRNLEDDLYDEYVVEAPPHPSELLALGVEPSEIDVNDPDKLRELYRKAKEEGKDKKTNSVLLARERQKEEIAEKKRTREEWKFFDSLTSRVEKVVKESQKNLDHWKESSTVSELAEPEYELRQTADEVFKPVTTVKLEKGRNDWIDFGDGGEGDKEASKQKLGKFEGPAAGGERRKSSAAQVSEFVVEELLEDLGLDLRTAKQRRLLQEKQKRIDLLEEQERLRRKEFKRKYLAELAEKERQAKEEAAPSVDIKSVARPRPRPKGAPQRDQEPTKREEPAETKEADIDPFQTSFVSEELVAPAEPAAVSEPEPTACEPEKPKFIDPFDTSYVKLE